MRRRPLGLAALALALYVVGPEAVFSEPGDDYAGVALYTNTPCLQLFVITSNAMEGFKVFGRWHLERDMAITSDGYVTRRVDGGDCDGPSTSPFRSRQYGE